MWDSWGSWEPGDRTTLHLPSGSLDVPGPAFSFASSAGSTSSSLSDHWLMRLGSLNNSTRGSLLSWSSAPCPSVARVPDSPVFTNGVCQQDKGMWLDCLFFSSLPAFHCESVGTSYREQKELVLMRGVLSLGVLPLNVPLHPSMVPLHPQTQWPFQSTSCILVANRPWMGNRKKN